MAIEVLKVLEDECYLRTNTLQNILSRLQDIIYNKAPSPEFLLKIFSIQSLIVMNTQHGSYTAGKVATSLHSTTMFVIERSMQKMSASLLIQQWSIGLEGLTVAKAPVCNIDHADYFDNDENVVALANHLKLEHEKLCLSLGT